MVYKKILRGVIAAGFPLKITHAYAELSEQKHVDEMILTGRRATAFLGCFTAINQLVKLCRGDGTRFFFLAALSVFVGELLTNSGALKYHFILTFFDVFPAAVSLSRDDIIINYLQVFLV